MVFKLVKERGKEYVLGDFTTPSGQRIVTMSMKRKDVERFKRLQRGEFTASERAQLIQAKAKAEKRP